MNSKGFEQGNFFIGCNYWASNAGMHMWHEWDEKAVEDDFRRLAENRVVNLRVFPLWSDFQPLRMHLAGGGNHREIRMREDLLPDTEAGRAGVDEVMLERFQKFCDLAEKYGLHLLVGLITGWMSGRLFVPEMFQERNVLTDPFAIKWEIKFVRLMVKRFRNHPAIMGWDLGNECNCMGKITSSEEAYVWASTISMAIRVEDPDHPIVSGMHGLSPMGNWRMQDQADFLDIFTTHPYPLFTPHCNTDPLNQMKSALHATAESRMYADLGGKPCFAEETGVLGPMMISDEFAADYIRACMFTLMAHDCRGIMWWCANEQKELTQTPYDWNAVERELGMFYIDGKKKPVLKTMTAFSEFVEKLPFDTMPDRIVDAVCILTRGQDNWAVAYGTFILAKQAGLDISFAWADGTIPEANAYILPSLEGDPMSRHTQYELMERVRKGAKLYLSIHGALICPMADFIGLRVLTRTYTPSKQSIELAGRHVELESGYTMRLESTGAEVLVKAADGNPVFSRYALGKGYVYSLFAPIERDTATLPNRTDAPDSPNLYELYKMMDMRSAEKTACVHPHTVGLTEHVADEHTHLLVAVNYEPFAQDAELTLKDGWHIVSCESMDNAVSVEGNVLHMSNNNGAVLTISDL